MKKYYLVYRNEEVTEEELISLLNEININNAEEVINILINIGAVKEL